MARMSAWERAALSRKAQVKPAVKPAGIGSFLAGKAKPVIKPAVKPAIKPAAKPKSAAVLKREALAKKFQNMKPFAGTIKLGGTVVKVSNGIFRHGGAVYAVSKDGRAVVRDSVLVGHVVRGTMQKVTPAFLSELAGNSFGRTV